MEYGNLFNQFIMLQCIFHLNNVVPLPLTFPSLNPPNQIHLNHFRVNHTNATPLQIDYVKQSSPRTTALPPRPYVAASPLRTHMCFFRWMYT